MKVGNMFDSDSPYLKAAEHPDTNKILVIDSVGQDVLNYDGQPPKEVIWVQFDQAPKPIVLSKTNGRNLIAALGDETDSWKGRKCLVSTKKYTFDNGSTAVGWVISPMPEEKPQVDAGTDGGAAGPDDDIPW